MMKTSGRSVKTFDAKTRVVVVERKVVESVGKGNRKRDERNFRGEAKGKVAAPSFAVQLRLLALTRVWSV